MRPSSLRGASAPLKTERCSFNSNLGHGYAGNAARCGTSLSKKQFPASETRRARATSFDAHKLPGSTPGSGAMKSGCCSSDFFWAKMLHGGALDYGSSKQPTTTLAALAWHPLRVHKQSRFDSGLRPQLSRVASITVMHWSLKPVIRVRFPGDPPRTEQPIGRDRDLRIRRTRVRGVGAPQQRGVAKRHRARPGPARPEVRFLSPRRYARAPEPPCRRAARAARRRKR